MLKIALLLNFYQGYIGIKRLLDSIPQGFADYLISVDGVYRYHKERNPDLPDQSDDGSRELIIESRHKFNHGIIIYNKANCTEFEKRNAYLEACEKLGDIDIVGIIVDDDEFFIVPAEATDPEVAFPRFKKNIETTITKYPNHNIFSIHTLDVANNYDIHRPRIWHRPHEIRYINGSHYHYCNIKTEQKEIEQFNQQRINYCQHSETVIKGVVLAHHHNLRSPEQMEMRDQYIEYLRRFEALTQSFYFTLDQAHELAKLGVNRNDVNIQNKDEIIKKYLNV